VTCLSLFSDASTVSRSKNTASTGLDSSEESTTREDVTEIRDPRIVRFGVRFDFQSEARFMFGVQAVVHRESDDDTSLVRGSERTIHGHAARRASRSRRHR
jgi:hypothetical protein